MKLTVINEVVSFQWVRHKIVQLVVAGLNMSEKFVTCVKVLHLVNLRIRALLSELAYQYCTS